MRTSASRPLAIATITAGVVLFAASPSLAGADRVRGAQPLVPYPVSAKGKPELLAAINQALLREGVIVRPMAGYRMPNFLRVSIGLPQENARFLEALAKVLSA